MTTAFIALRSRSARAWDDRDVELAQTTMAHSGEQLGVAFRPFGRSEDGATYVFEAQCERIDVGALREELASYPDFARVYAISAPVDTPRGPFVFD